MGEPQCQPKAPVLHALSPVLPGGCPEALVHTVSDWDPGTLRTIIMMMTVVIVTGLSLYYASHSTLLRALTHPSP